MRFAAGGDFIQQQRKICRLVCAVIAYYLLIADQAAHILFARDARHGVIGGKHGLYCFLGSHNIRADHTADEIPSRHAEGTHRHRVFRNGCGAVQSNIAADKVAAVQFSADDRIIHADAALCVIKANDAADIVPSDHDSSQIFLLHGRIVQTVTDAAVVIPGDTARIIAAQLPGQRLLVLAVAIVVKAAGAVVNYAASAVIADDAACIPRPGEHNPVIHAAANGIGSAAFRAAAAGNTADIFPTDHRSRVDGVVQVSQIHTRNTADMASAQNVSACAGAAIGHRSIIVEADDAADIVAPQQFLRDLRRQFRPLRLTAAVPECRTPAITDQAADTRAVLLAAQHQCLIAAVGQRNRRLRAVFRSAVTQAACHTAHAGITRYGGAIDHARQAAFAVTGHAADTGRICRRIVRFSRPCSAACNFRHRLRQYAGHRAGHNDRFNQILRVFRAFCHADHTAHANGGVRTRHGSANIAVHGNVFQCAARLQPACHGARAGKCAAFLRIQ